MAAVQNFRGAFHGFNREDVVRYIEYINNKHNSQVNQLTTEIQILQAELTQLRGTPDLRTELDEANARCVAMEQELNALRTAVESRPQTDNELEAYRRAERAERVANERVTQLYQQANGALADATIRVDETTAKITELADTIGAQLAEMQSVLSTSKKAMKDAAAAMYAVRPISTQE